MEPESIERVLLKALTKDRDDRYATVTEFYAAFDRAVADRAASAPSINVASVGAAAPIAAPTPIAMAKAILFIPYHFITAFF